MDEERGYKRVHFFKYHLQPDDWQQRHVYHWQKYELHTHDFHGWGIVPEHRGELLVTQRGRGEMAVEIAPGYAVDPEAHDILVEDGVTLEVSRDALRLPCTIYFVLRYVTTPVDARRTEDGRREHKYFAEGGKIELVTRPPQDGEIELARVALSADVYKITNARNPEAPRQNEIDLTHRRYCRIYRGLDPSLRLELLRALRTRREAYLRVGGNRLLRPAAAMAHCLSSLEMVVRADMLDRRSALRVLDAVNMLDTNLVSLIRDQSGDPYLDQRPEFIGLQTSANTVHSLLDGPPSYQLENFDSIVTFLGRGNDTYGPLWRTYGDESLVYYPGQEPVLAKHYPLSDDWQRIMVWSAEFPEILYVDGLEWRLLGELNVTDEASEKRFNFRIHNAIDAWRTRQRLYYPDGTQVDDTGVAHEGGYAEYEIKGVTPDTHLAVIRMMDYARADYELEFVVNDQPCGISQCLGHDLRARWRNWPFVIPAWYVNDDVVRVKQIMNTAARDVNMFRYWFYQPVDI